MIPTEDIIPIVKKQLLHQLNANTHQGIHWLEQL